MICASSLKRTRFMAGPFGAGTAPGAPPSPAAPALTLTWARFNTGSTLRSVTGKIGCERSMMPKPAANLASGEPSPVRVFKGNDAALTGARPLSSANFAGRVTTSSAFSANGGLKVTRLTAAS